MRNLTIVVLMAAVSMSWAYERMMGYEDSVLTMDEGTPCPAVVSYDRSEPETSMHLYHLVLGRVDVRLRDGEEMIALRDGGNVVSMPHGLRARSEGPLGRIEVEAVPLIAGRETQEQDGGAVMKLAVTARQQAELVVGFGGLGSVKALGANERVESINDPDWGLAAGDTVRLRSGAAWLSAPDVHTADSGITVAAALVADGGGRISPEVMEAGAEGSPVAQWRCELATGKHALALCIAFGEREERITQAIRGLSPRPYSAVRRTRDYFGRLTAGTAVSTPAPAIDECFRWALLNLEYTYYRDLGWMECLHHWVTFFQPVHTMAADALGQCERSRAVLRAAAEGLSPEGRAMDFTPAGRTWRAYAWDQYFQWCARHTWRATGDDEFLDAMWPALARNMEYVRRKWDTDNNGLYGFNQQIGWQEDYVYSYEDSGSPSIAFADIAAGLADMAEATGRHGDGARYRKLAARSKNKLRKLLWEPELGRFINCRDRRGARHYEGQYHTFCWPGQLGLVDPLDAYTSAHHMVSVLSTPRGLIYVSNNFPTHVPHTVGCQEGSAQPAFAALALGRQGWAEECASILESEGKLIVAPPLSGSFPETMTQYPSWFSAPAGAYAQAVIEGLFGLRRNVPDKAVEVTPALPSHWSKASVRLPWVRAEFRQAADERWIELKLDRPLALDVRWWLPVCDVISVVDNGETVPFTVEAGPGRVILRAETDVAQRHELQIQMRPRNWQVEYEREVEPGGTAEVVVKNCTLRGIVDREGLCEDVELHEQMAMLDLREDLMREFDVFGPWGRTQFLDRVLFLRAEASGVKFFIPVELELTPTEPAAPIHEQVRELARDPEYAWQDVELPEEELRPSAMWRQWRHMDDVGHQPWARQPDPLKAEAELVGDDGRIHVPEGQLSFAAPQGKVIPVGSRGGTECVSIRMNSDCRAIALLLLPVLYNEDAFSQVGEVTVQTFEGEVVGHRKLYFPGDLDWMHPPQIVGDYATVGKGWSRSPAVNCSSSVMSVVYVPVNPPGISGKLEIRTTAERAVLAIAGIAALRARTATLQDLQEKSADELPTRILIADFEEGNLEGWAVEGEAWGASEAGGYFQRYGRGQYFADSRHGGESAIGTVRSPVFRIVRAQLTWLADGWSADGLNYFRIADARTDETLATIPPPDHTGQFPRLSCDASAFEGREVYFEAVDRCTENAFAWLAFDGLMLTGAE